MNKYIKNTNVYKDTFLKTLSLKRKKDLIKKSAEILRRAHLEIKNYKLIKVLDKLFFISPNVFYIHPCSVFMVKNLKVYPGEKVLDIGTGTGIQAIFAADTAHSVIATDINPFALKLARLNSKLNKVESKIEFREGSLFDPVKGEKFDLIIWTPPWLQMPPKNILEVSWCNENVTMLLQNFFKDVNEHLTHNGRIQIIFSNLGPIEDMFQEIMKYKYKFSIISSMKTGLPGEEILCLLLKK